MSDTTRDPSPADKKRKANDSEAVDANKNEPTIAYAVMEDWMPEDIGAEKGTGCRIVAQFDTLEGAKNFAAEYIQHVAKITAVAWKHDIINEELRLPELSEVDRDEYDSIDDHKVHEDGDGMGWYVNWAHSTYLRVVETSVRRGDGRGWGMPVPLMGSDHFR